MSNLNLYEFYFDFGRAGDVTGRFLATPEEVAGMIGRRYYFGEILGKHSEICGEVDESEITLVTDDQTFLAMAAQLNIDLTSGHDLKEAMEEDEEDEEYED